MDTFDFGNEVVKAALQFAFTVIVGGFVGIVWAVSKRRREGRVAAQEAFYKAYGRWFAVWKEWGAAIEATKAVTGGRSDPGLVPDAVVFTLRTKAAEVEAEFESVLIRLAVEHRLSAEQRRHLGQFREGVQELRNRLKLKRKLDWAVMSSAPYRTEAYVLFKARSVEVARLIGGASLLSPGSWFRPSLVEAQQALVEVTSWRAPQGGWHVNDHSRFPVEQARATLDRLSVPSPAPTPSAQKARPGPQGREGGGA